MENNVNKGFLVLFQQGCNNEDFIEKTIEGNHKRFLDIDGDLLKHHPVKNEDIEKGYLFSEPIKRIVWDDKTCNVEKDDFLYIKKDGTFCKISSNADYKQTQLYKDLEGGGRTIDEAVETCNTIEKIIEERCYYDDKHKESLEKFLDGLRKDIEKYRKPVVVFFTNKEREKLIQKIKEGNGQDTEISVFRKKVIINEKQLYRGFINVYSPYFKRADIVFFQSNYYLELYDNEQQKVIAQDNKCDIYDSLREIIEKNKDNKELQGDIMNRLQNFYNEYNKIVEGNKIKNTILFDNEYIKIIRERIKSNGYGGTIIRCNSKYIFVTEDDCAKGYILPPCTERNDAQDLPITFIDNNGKVKNLIDSKSYDQDMYIKDIKRNIDNNIITKERKYNEILYDRMHRHIIVLLIEDKRGIIKLPEKIKNSLTAFAKGYRAYIQERRRNIINVIEKLKIEKNGCYSPIRKYRINKHIEYCYKMLNKEVNYNQRILNNMGNVPNGLQSTVCEYNYPWET